MATGETIWLSRRPPFWPKQALILTIFAVFAPEIGDGASHFEAKSGIWSGWRDSNP
ncbi:MAG: hypothetical protein JW967_10295 [Dehalococcoidales bacterium]|nr:hypothetical protein [Dehalococcoidales bacterium]